MLTHTLYTILSQTVQGETRENVLSVFVDEWKWYQSASKLASITFHYLDQHWVPKEIEKKTQNVYPIFEV